MNRPRATAALLVCAVVMAACGGQAISAPSSASTASEGASLDKPVTVDQVLAEFGTAFSELADQTLGPEQSALIEERSQAAAQSLALMRGKIGADPTGGGVPGRSSVFVVTAGGGKPAPPGIVMAIGLTWAAATRGNSASLKDTQIYDPSLDTAQVATADVDSGQTKIQTKMAFTPEGPTATADTSVTMTTTGSGGDQLVDTAQAHLHGDVCPDPSGVVKVDYTVVWDANAKGRHGTGTIHVDAAGDGTATVDDTASVASITANGSATYGIGSTLGTSAHRQGSFTFETKANQPTLTKSDGALPPGFTEDNITAIRDLPYNLVKVYMQYAESAWTTGSCVEIHTTGVDAAEQTWVAAASTKSFVGKVFHRWDNKTPQFPLEASLQGAKSLTPNGKQTAPVTYSYQAPNDKGQNATVHLESRSRRGVATLDLALFTGRPSYVASGGQHIEMSGTIPNLDKSFDLTGTGGDGVDYQFHYSEGTFFYSGSQQGCTEEGSGTYDVTLSDDELSGTIVMNTAKIAVTCRGRTMTRANLPPVTFTITAQQ